MSALRSGHVPAPSFSDATDVAALAGREDDAEASLYALAEPLLRRGRLLLGVPLVIGVVAALGSLFVPNQYTAVTTFSTDAGQDLLGSLGGLAGLAGQFGVRGLTGATVPPEYFASLLHSRSILERTVRDSFAWPSDSAAPSARRPLLVALDVDGDTPNEILGRSIEELDDRIETSVDKQTGVVSLAVEMPDPDLAAAVANRMVALVEDFNRTTRQSQSRAQREFTGTRLAQAASELRTAEADRLQFLSANRTRAGSPVLEYEDERLSRDIQLKQDVYVTLTRKFEEARIAEVQDTPTLTRIDAAAPPFEKSSPKRALLVVALATLAFLLCAGWIYGVAYLERMQRVRPNEHAAFRASLATFWKNIGRAPREQAKS
jgi:uncharacterized protein involved in exopolysaccharide biosynthesis